MHEITKNNSRTGTHVVTGRHGVNVHFSRTPRNIRSIKACAFPCQVVLQGERWSAEAEKQEGEWWLEVCPRMANVCACLNNVARVKSIHTKTRRDEPPCHFATQKIWLMGGRRPHSHTHRCPCGVAHFTNGGVAQQFRVMTIGLRDSQRNSRPLCWRVRQPVATHFACVFNLLVCGGGAGSSVAQVPNAEGGEPILQGLSAHGRAFRLCLCGLFICAVTFSTAE